MPADTVDPSHPHLIDGEFQSDKYPTCPRGKVPLSCKDSAAQDLLWAYAQRRRAVDPEFSADLELALSIAGFAQDGCGCARCLRERQPDVTRRFIVCTLCGSKSCPHAIDHRRVCTLGDEPAAATHPMPADTDAERLAEARAWYAQRPDMTKEGVTPFLLRLLDEREADIAKLRDIIAAAYQVVGALAHYTGTFYNDDVIRALGAFSDPDGPANVDLLPWPKGEIVTTAAQDAEHAERVPSGSAMDTAADFHVSWGPDADKMSQVERDAIVDDLRSMAATHRHNHDAARAALADIPDYVAVPVDQLADIYKRFKRLSRMGQATVDEWLVMPKQEADLRHAIFAEADFGALYAGQHLPRNVYNAARQDIKGDGT